MAKKTHEGAVILMVKKANFVTNDTAQTILDMHLWI